MQQFRITFDSNLLFAEKVDTTPAYDLENSRPRN